MQPIWRCGERNHGSKDGSVFSKAPLMRLYPLFMGSGYNGPVLGYTTEPRITVTVTGWSYIPT